MDTLSQWESEANASISTDPKTHSVQSLLYFNLEDNKRVIALIELIRKKDEELTAIYNTLFSVSEASRRSDCDHAKLLAAKAIALTVDVEKELG